MSYNKDLSKGKALPTGKVLDQTKTQIGSKAADSQPKATHDAISDYSDDWSAGSPNKKPSEALDLKKKAESKKLVTEHIASRGKGGATAFGDDDDDAKRGPDQVLDDLWEKFRDFINGVGKEKEKLEMSAQQLKETNIRIALANQFAVYDKFKKGYVSLSELKSAFVAARLPAAAVPTESQWTKLVYSLEAWQNESARQVNYNRFLDAVTTRETVSVHGIFPKPPPKQVSKYEETLKKRAEEDEKKEKAQAAAEREALEASKNRRLVATVGGADQTDSKQAAKRSAKEDAAIQEQEKREALIKQEEEALAVKKEVNELKVVIAALIEKSDKAKLEGKDIRKWFGLFDHDKSGDLDQTELQQILKHAGSRTSSDQLDKLFRLLDTSGDGKVSYREFCNVVERRSVPDYATHVKKERARRLKEEENKFAYGGAGANLKSHAADVGSSEYSRDQKLGKVEGLSSVMGRSVIGEERTVPKLIDSQDSLRVQGVIKELLREGPGGKPRTFDDLLQLMGKPKGSSNIAGISMADFETAVRATGGFSKSQLSAHDIKQVFRQHAKDAPSRGGFQSSAQQEQFIPVREFKDKFLPALGWSKDDGADITSPGLNLNKANSNAASDETASVIVDQMMEGKRPSKEARKSVTQKPTSNAGTKLAPVAEDDAQSQDSRISKPIDELAGGKSQDPSKKRQLKKAALASVPEKRGGEGFLSQEALDAHNAKIKVNDQYFKQPQAVLSAGARQEQIQSSKDIDKSIDRFFRKFCKALLEEQSADYAGGLDCFIEQYGRENPGYLSYSEFKEIFREHALRVINPTSSTMPEEGKILALFNVFDVQSRGKISRADFVNTVKQAAPPLHLVERLGNKVKKGGERLLKALTEEFQEADAPFGCNGQLPLSNFQVIMNDYDLPLLQGDLTDLEKRGFVQTDDIECKFVDYIGVLAQVRPKAQAMSTQPALLARAVVRMQSAWRGHKARREAAQRRAGAAAALAEVGEVISALRAGDASALSKAGGKGAKAKGAKGTSAGGAGKESGRGKLQQSSKGRQEESAADLLDAKMAGVARSGKDGKHGAKNALISQQIAEYIRTSIIEEMIEASFCYGESLGVCRTVQRRFETRPVAKFLFPMIREFEFGVQGVLPKSLQAINALGQVMCLDSENQLNQFDVATARSLQSVNLGTKPPLKAYDIIDMVCDQSSGRIYTLNANWILEIWNIEQNVAFPQKRMSVCANEGGKDFINLYYQQNFNNSKPRFLALQECNQQILLVNTSCVDGSIVFIDPISFSVLKKVQLRYSDFELPAHIKASVKHLQGIFEVIKEKQGKDVAHIFAEITDRETQEVQIRDFVQSLLRLDPTLPEDQLYQCCRQLDADGSGTITLDEFLEYFGSLHNNDDVQDDVVLQDEMWPEWLIQDGHLDRAQGLLSAMFVVLEHDHGISAEQAFGIYDMKDSGDCSQDEFSRVLKIFFGEAIPKKEDLQFINKLAIKRGDRVDYRDFCKFLSKKVVRTFNSSGPNGNSEGGNEMTALERELQRPLRKDASLSYALRKAAELGIDLRQNLQSIDKNELSVISRNKFTSFLLDLPLGLNEVDVQEILDNDLQFDNYGNVEYTTVLNSDLFCTLERQRLKAIHQKKKRSVKMGESKKIDKAPEPKQVDNRKVVVEDLIYIDDLEILVYTTIVPISSYIFINSVKKQSTSASGDKVEVLTLQKVAQDEEADENQAQVADTNQYYKFLARLRGHQNSDPPTICYVPQSCCLITGEKHLNEAAYAAPKSSFPSTADPTVPSSHKFLKSNQSAYEKHQQRGQKGPCCEILIWNLQRDLVELFQSRPPWNMTCHHRIQAHNSSIIDICFLNKSQLLVTASTDQTIKFFDPVSTSYELTDPSNNPHAGMRPGHYSSLKREVTKSNSTFKEIKRIYTGQDTSCFSLRCLDIPNIAVDPTKPELKSQIEWLVALKLGKPQTQAGRNTQVGFICGYGIERVQIEVPALHHDDVVPPFVLKECEELVTARRRKIVATFQRNLEHTISKIFSQVQLQENQIAKVRNAFMRAILQRKELKYVNAEPLREIYQLLLQLPDRAKFQNFLASSGCTDKLSVSETFFYLQKFQQIHPLRTTQIEFERSIQEFHDKHQRQFLKGVKRWPKQSVQSFADHIRRSGLDLQYLQAGGPDGKKFSTFCTRERFAQYFQEIVRSKGDYFSSLDVDSILNDLDPFFTGAVQIALVKKVYQEELLFYKQTSLNRPNEIMEDIRRKAFPNKRVQLQLALAAADQQGDGYLQLKDFIGAFQHPQLGLDFQRDTLEFLFNVLSEVYTLPKTEFDQKSVTIENDEAENQDRVLSLTFFMGKLFRSHEQKEIDEVDQTLGQIKAALVYKGLDFSVIFAERSEDGAAKKSSKGRKSKDEQKKEEDLENGDSSKKPQGLDMTMHYTRFSQQIVKEEFCSRIDSLGAEKVTPESVRRLATFLALNQANQSIVYLSSWLHHLRRANTAFQVADKKVLPLICVKLLRNEKVFRSWLESCGHIRGKREEEKFIEIADLRQVLTKLGVSYMNQEIFLKEFARGDAQVHVEDLITRLKATTRKHYQSTGQSQNDETVEAQTMEEMRLTDFFSKVQTAIRRTGTQVNSTDLLSKAREFDPLRTGTLKIYILVNILKHNYGDIFSEECLIGLQFQLECLSDDGTLDYQDFIKVFFEDGLKSKTNGDMRIKEKSTLTVQDYEDLLSKISSHIKEQGLDLMRIFDIFCKKGGLISFEDLGKILDLIEFPASDMQLELIKKHADENHQGTLHAYDFAQRVVHAEVITPSFDINRWISASRDLNGRTSLLEMLTGAIASMKDQMITRFGDAEARHSGVITSDCFQELLAAECPSLSEQDKHILSMFAVKGSRRVHGVASTRPSNSAASSSDLVQLYHVEQALEETIQTMRKEAVVDSQNQNDEAQSADLAKFRKAVEAEAQAQRGRDTQQHGSAQSSRMRALRDRVISLFRERDVSFFDCFQSLYDPLNPKASVITIGEFKKKIRELNLPLSVQEYRLLRRIADPRQLGKVDIKTFCTQFETADLRQRRLNKILDKIATAFFLQGFNMRRAFALFDADGDGQLSTKEFRQGMTALNLNLRFDEIDDLMRLCDNNRDGQVSYDEFISKMDVSMKNRKAVVLEQVEGAFFQKLGEALEGAGSAALTEAMAAYDSGPDGTIATQDLPRALKTLGIMNPEPHLPAVIRAGRGPESGNGRIDYEDFCLNLEAEIRKRQRQAASVHENILQKISEILKSSEITLFEFFVMIDVNQKGSVSNLELKTGVQQLGLNATSKEFDSLWSALHKPVSQMSHVGQSQGAGRGAGQRRSRTGPKTEAIDYIDLIAGFSGAGCLKLQQALDHGDALLGKLRAQLKKSKISDEKAFKLLDPANVGVVAKKDFVDLAPVNLGLQLSEPELVRLFECICEEGAKKTTSKDQQSQQQKKPSATGYAHFSQRDLSKSVLVQHDESFMFQACIKVHAVVLQKGLSYKRLFAQWKDKQSKTQAGRLAERELAQGLKRLKAGLTSDEIEKLCGGLRYEGKDTSVGASDFEKHVRDGARKLEAEQSFERMILQEWIVQFDDCRQRVGAPIERLFQEHDSTQTGGLTFPDFAGLNEQLGVCMPRKDLQRIFGILDRKRTQRVTLDSLRGVASLLQRDDAALAPSDDDNLSGLAGEELIRKQELDDVYETVKEVLESRGLTLETIIYSDLKYSPTQLANFKGLQQIFIEGLDISITQRQAESILADLRAANQGTFECSFKTFIDFMTRKRINVAFVDKGFIDPLIAQCCQNLAKAKEQMSLTFEKLFCLFAGAGGTTLTKEKFLKCAQGLERDMALEDLIELFNYMDDKGANEVAKVQFVDALTYVTNRLGASSLESQGGRGGSSQKKSASSRQGVLAVMNHVAEAVHQKQLSMRQVMQILDVNGTGYMNTKEFSQVIRALSEVVSLEQTRLLLAYFDERGTGRISVAELCSLLQDLINQQIGGGVYAFMQVKPLIQSIISQLAVDADQFFDELALQNDELQKQEAEAPADGHSVANRNQLAGLSKPLFFGQLAAYGVSLSEQEKALFAQVFLLEGANLQLDYLKLDQAFEGEQQRLYAHADGPFTVDWERRIHKKIGEYLKRHNLTIEACFDAIDDDNSQTCSDAELKQALNRFGLGLSEQQFRSFFKALTGEEKAKHISRDVFIQRFWSAYTYSNATAAVEEAAGSAAGSMLPTGSSDGSADRGRIATGLQQKLKKLKTLRAIQESMKRAHPAAEAFTKLDSGVGFLTLRDFQRALPRHFDLTLRQHELTALFLEVDSDENGIVKYAEWDAFYHMDFEKRVQALSDEKERLVTQYDIFDHLLKVLKQKGLTLEEMFDQIDLDKNQFIEVDEFHQTLECMGFLITEEQVFELMRQMDDNFDGKISYAELKAHILRLGFSLSKTLESRVSAGPQKMGSTFVWRDKGLEIIIGALQRGIGSQSYEEYFTKFDYDHDGHLQPSEFRQAMLSLKDGQLGRPQIERVLHVLLEQKQAQPLVSIPRVATFLRGYKCLDEETGQAPGAPLLIDEDLFVYIVERYDGFSRLVEQFSAVDERSQYIARHTHEVNLRGLDMLANQMNLNKIHQRSQAVCGLYETTLILLAGEANRLIRDEAQLCVLDPTESINKIVTNVDSGSLSAVRPPMIENSSFDIDFNSGQMLPSGAQKYRGVMPKTRKSVEILIYPNENLAHVSADGKAYSAHVQLELQVHRYLMGARYDDDEGLDPENMSIFHNFGKFEKKVGLAASDKEIFVVNEQVNEDEWINLDDFVMKNGGILNIPLFYHTDAPLFIIRHWAKLLLAIIKKVHDVSAVLRCLQLGQVWVSRDGQRIKLGHVRGVGKVNNFGSLASCPDIQLSLEDSGEDTRIGGSTTQGAGQKLGGAASSSKKTDAARSFSNSCLDNPFIAPETLFSKFLDQSSSLDVWSFGMIMYCLLLGKKPESYYSSYRAWYKKHHGHDVEMAPPPTTSPFIPPSSSNFLYDPFAIDLENPLDGEEMWMDNDAGIDLQGSLKEKKGTINFENFVKCLEAKSYSGLFTQENSKKFYFKNIGQRIDEAGISKDGPKIPRYAGHAPTNDDQRLRMMQAFARADVLSRKNELGLILDLLSSCLDSDSKRRPSINGLLTSPLFMMDDFEQTKAVRFSQNVILYRSPQSSVSLRLTAPLRGICGMALKHPERLLQCEADILRMFAGAEDCVAHISSLPLDEINDVLTQEERRKALADPSRQAAFRGKDYSKLRVSPNSPLAAQIVEDRVIDMLIFLTFRYTKAFGAWKQRAALADAEGGSPTERTRLSGTGATERTASSVAASKTATKRAQNQVLIRMTRLLKTLVYELHSYSTPMAPYVKEVAEYVLKLYVGEEYELGSDSVLRRTTTTEIQLKDYLRERSFFRKEDDLTENFKSDATDKVWHLEQKNMGFLDKSNHWSIELQSEANKIYRDAITESGMGQSCYPVLNDYIQNVTNSFEPSKIFSKQMNHLSVSFLVPMNRTTAYYNELGPLTECISRLYSPDLEKAGKRCALAMIRSIFQTGSSDKVKACLDMRVPKHIIHFLQDADGDVRKECLLTLLEISKGLQDDDFEILGKTAANLKQEYSRRGFRKTAFDQHKAISLASQSEGVEAEQDGATPGTSNKSKKGQPEQSEADAYTTYIKRTIALIEKNENKRFINFALDLPNLNFLASKRFLREMAVCFESPVFIAPLTRLLKSKTESYPNKEIIIQIAQNIFCGNEKVLTAFNSPSCDAYLTLLRLLMQNTKMQHARSNPAGQTAQMRNQLQLQDKTIDLFRFMFDQRRPTIIRDLNCIGASSTLLKEQGLKIPELISLADIVSYFDESAEIQDLKPSMIVVNDFLLVIKDLRCWVKHFYKESSIPELTRIKALQRCSNFLVRVVGLVWDDYKNVNPERKLEYLQLIKSVCQLFDWLCVKGHENFMFNEQSGKENLAFIIDRCNRALSQFRAPAEQTQLPLEDLAHDSKSNKKTQSLRKYDLFPFTEIGAILQNILYQLVRQDSGQMNILLAQANFGFIFAEQMILEYDFIRHCIDNKIESMVLIDSYVKKNEIRLNTYECLLRSSCNALKDQLIQSTFIDKLFQDYIGDFREFNVQFSKIDLEFLSFRRSFPIRLECISLVNTTIMHRPQAPRIFSELVMYCRRHLCVKQELDLLRRGRLTHKESTALLMFAIFLESNEEDLICIMMQEGVPEEIRRLTREHPSLGRKFPILTAYSSTF